MDIIAVSFDIVIHLDRYLAGIIQAYGPLTYAILFFIIFMETGFVITPFLPGDSLLFAAGALSATGAMDVKWLFFLLSAAAILGDTINYWVGFFIGPKIFREKNVRFLNKEYLGRTHKFYEKYGGKVIILARFIPIIRTFAPFVAGIGRMTYWRFLSFNVIGGIVWIAIFIFGGYQFGNIPVVKANFNLVVLIIILLSIIPLGFELLQRRVKRK